MSVTMCSALDSVEIIEYSNELWDYPGWNHEVDIKVFPVEVNLLIREYVACMLLSEKLEWELAKDSKIRVFRGRVNNPSPLHNDILWILDQENTEIPGASEYDEYEVNQSGYWETHAYEQLAIWIHFSAAMLFDNFLIFTDLAEYFEGDQGNSLDVSHTLIPFFWTTGSDELDEKVAYDTIGGFFREIASKIMDRHKPRVEKPWKSFLRHIKIYYRDEWNCMIKNTNGMEKVLSRMVMEVEWP